MRLAVLLDRWHPRGGGLEVYLRHVLPALARCGHEVRLYARDASLEPPAEVVPVELRRPWPRPWRDRSEAAAQWRRLRKDGCEVGFGLRSVPCPGGVFLPMGGSAPHVRAARGADSSPSFRERSLLALEERTLQEASLVLPPSPMVAREIAERRPDVDSLTLPLPLLRAPTPLLDRDADAGRALRIVHCGRDADRHGAGPALAWFRALCGRGHRARMDLWSKSIRHAERSLGMTATELAREGVVLRAWEDDFLGTLARADLLLHPTRYDSFSLVCLEAVAHGVPVLTTAAAGAADLLPESCCATTSREDAEAAAERAEELLETTRATPASTRRDQVVEVRRRFALEAHVAALESALLGAVGRFPSDA